MSTAAKAPSKSNHLAPEIRALARELGLCTEYVDHDGQRRLATREAVLAMLRALSVEVRTEREAALYRVERHRQIVERGAPHVCVAWSGQLDALRLHAREPALRGAWELTLLLEDGRSLVRSGQLADAMPVQASGRSAVHQLALPLGLSLPLGYHRLDLSIGQRTSSTLVIAAPRRAPEPRARSFGVFAPTYALRGEGGQGSGTLRELADLCTMVGSAQGTFVGTLPLTAQFLDDPYDTSPFAPASRLFWNELVLDLDALHGLGEVPEAHALRHSPAFASELLSLEASPHVRAREKVRLVHALLGPLSRAFFASGGERHASFAAYLAQNPYAREYACFRATVDAHGGPAHWTPSLRASALEPAPERVERTQLHLFAQWQMHAQLEQLTRRAKHAGVRLYMDMPVGVHSESFDVFREPSCFVQGVNAGAPPDALCPEGQDWGFSPAHPEGQRAQHYRYLRAYLRTQLAHAGMLRIDHVMGLARIFCVPHGLGADRGVYLEQPQDELVAVLTLEAERAGSWVVGEDLGLVPEGVRLTMRARGMSGMYVLPFELRTDAKSAVLARPRSDSLATLNTHDMPTFKGAWHGDDIVERRERGALTQVAASAELRARKAQRKALLQALSLPQGASCEAAFRAALVHLGASEARFVQVALEDLWAERLPQNVPGTFAPDRNFTRRTRASLGAEAARESARRLLALLAEARKGATPHAALATNIATMPAETL